MPRKSMPVKAKQRQKVLGTKWLINTLQSKRKLTEMNDQRQLSRGVLMKRVLKICSKFTGEHPCQSGISIKLQTSFNEIALQHGCSPENYCIFSKQLFVRTTYLLHIFRTPFPKTTSGWLLLNDSLMKSFFWSAALEEIWLKSFKYI